MQVPESPGDFGRKELDDPVRRGGWGEQSDDPSRSGSTRVQTWGGAGPTPTERRRLTLGKEVGRGRDRNRGPGGSEGGDVWEDMGVRCRDGQKRACGTRGSIPCFLLSITPLLGPLPEETPLWEGHSSS